VIDPAWGPFLFDTSAESWLARTAEANARGWFGAYLSLHSVHISAITVIERIRGYALLAKRAPEGRRAGIEAARISYLQALGRVWPVDGSIAVVAGEIMALLPQPPTPSRRAHRRAESKQDRLVRWRFDVVVAATALVTRMTLIHHNAADFEAIRGTIERSPERFPGLGPLQLLRCESVA
jgi:predicted nucleic acid-binding protein